MLHISQLSNSRVEAEDIPHIIAVGEEVFVKVIARIRNILYINARTCNMQYVYVHACVRGR